jgi:anaphase-promoting complex subunit 1
MDKYSVSTIWLENLPIGVAYPLRIALSACKRQPLSSWSESTYDLIDRKDLVQLLRMHMHGSEIPSTYKQTQKQIEDVSMVTEICQKVQTLEAITSGPTPSLTDDHEAVTNLIFRNDQRMLEVVKLLEYSQSGVTFWLRASSMAAYNPKLALLIQ